MILSRRTLVWLTCACVLVAASAVGFHILLSYGNASNPSNNPLLVHLGTVDRLVYKYVAVFGDGTMIVAFKYDDDKWFGIKLAPYHDEDSSSRKWLQADIKGMSMDIRPYEQPQDAAQMRRDAKELARILNTKVVIGNKEEERQVMSSLDRWLSRVAEGKRP